MNWLKQHRLALRQALAHADPGRGAERKIGGVDAVIGAVGQYHLQIDNGKTERPSRKTVVDPFFDRGNVVARYRATNNRFVELEAFTARQRLDFQYDIHELRVAAGLLLVPTALGDWFANGFLIAHRGGM